MVKKTLLAACLLMAISALALGQVTDTSYRVRIQLDPDKEEYYGDVFCVIESAQSIDTLTIDGHGILFRDSLPVLRISVFLRPKGDSAFYKQRSFKAIDRDTALTLPWRGTSRAELFVEDEAGMISLAPLRVNGILELQQKACLQISIAKQWTVAVGCSCAYLYRETPLDREIRRTQEIKDFLFRSQWSYYILDD